MNSPNAIIVGIIYNTGRQSQIIEIQLVSYLHFKSEFQTSLSPHNIL